MIEFVILMSSLDSNYIMEWLHDSYPLQLQQGGTVGGGGGWSGVQQHSHEGMLAFGEREWCGHISYFLEIIIKWGQRMSYIRGVKLIMVHGLHET